MRLLKVLIALLIPLLMLPALAQESRFRGQIRHAAPDAPDAVKQWNFAVGEWDVTFKTRQEDGSVETSESKAYVRGYYLDDGLTFQSEFQSDSPTDGGDGFYSTMIKAYDTTQKKWINQFVNSRRQRWTTTESVWRDDEMVTTIPGGYAGDEPYIQREVDSEISPYGWTKRLFRSTDDGKSWEEQPLTLYYSRRR